MTWSDIFYGIGDAFEVAFVGIEFLGDNFNWLIAVVGIILFGYWLKRQAKYDKEAKENDTYL